MKKSFMRLGAYVPAYSVELVLKTINPGVVRGAVDAVVPSPDCQVVSPNARATTSPIAAQVVLTSISKRVESEESTNNALSEHLEKLLHTSTELPL